MKLFPLLSLLAISPQALMLLAPAPARAAELSAHIQTDFTQHYNVSDRIDGNTDLPEKMLSRDLGFSARWRAAITLMTRGTRKFQLLAGPYIRLPVVFSFTHYGAEFSATQSLEIGGDIGVDWLGYARLLFTFAPDWSLSYKTTDLSPSQPGTQTLATYDHWSAGVRLEVPVYWLESDPGDRRAEFGLTGTFALDRIRSVEFQPIGFTPGPGDSSLVGQSLFNARETSHRWIFGVFMNFRI